MAGGQFLGFGADVGNITTSAIQTVIGSVFCVTNNLAPKFCFFLQSDTTTDTTLVLGNSRFYEIFMEF